MKTGTELLTNSREIVYEIWNHEMAVTSSNAKNVVFEDQTTKYPGKPHQFKSDELATVRDIAMTYNATIVRITTSTIKVQERTVVE